MRRWSVVLLCAAAVAGPLTGVVETSHFKVRFRPGSWAGAAADRAAAMAERDLARICSLLGIANDGSYELYLYDDVAELAAITKTQGNAGFSAGNQVHVPFDNDQTRFHELVHVVAYRLPKTGEEPRSLFFAEGLANALLEYVHDVHVHAQAAFYRRTRKLPGLAEMTGAADFYAWLRAHPGFNGYDVAASWFRFLLDTQPVEAVRRYYTGTPAKAAFGASLAKLEKGWHRVLDGFQLRPEVETLLRQRAGEAVEFELYPLDPWLRLPEEVRGKDKDWTVLAATPRHSPAAERWAHADGAWTGSSPDGNWVWRELGKRKLKSAAISARIRPAPNCIGVQVRLGGGVQAMLVQNGVFLYDAQNRPLHASQKARLSPASPEIHILLLRRKSHARVWVDGVLVLEGRVGSEAARPGFGVALGTASFRDLKIRTVR